MATSVNFKVRTQAVAYSEGLKDGMAILVTALEESGSTNGMLDILEANCRPEDAHRLREFYKALNASRAL